MSIVAEQSRGKIANNHSDLCPAAFRLSVESTINTNHRLCFKYLVCFLRSVSVLRQPGSLLRHAGTRSTSAFAPFLHEQLLPFITRNVSLHRFSERPRSPRRGDKPKFSKPAIYASSVQRIVLPNPLPSRFVEHIQERSLHHYSKREYGLPDRNF